MKAYNGNITVHPSGIIETYGTVKGKRETKINIYLTDAAIAELQEVFEFARMNNIPLDHLGHAYWHIHEKHPAGNCTSCDFAK